MNRIGFLKVLNVALFLLFLLQVTSGLLMVAGVGAAFVAHLAGGACLVLCGAAHLALNWGWVKMQYFRTH
jgi:hypothetical protein